MTISAPLANRLGFVILGLTNNFAYVIMLSAAYDLLNHTENPSTPKTPDATSNLTSTNIMEEKPYCNEQSTSTILLADTLPSLTTKIIYPFLLVGIRPAYKAVGTAILSAISFLVTGLTTSQVLIFAGVASASFSSGLGESTFLSHTPLYGDVSLSGWSMGTGAAGLLGSVAYALLRMILSIKIIMIIMLIVPIAMLVAYFCIIVPVPVENLNFDASQGNKRAPESGGLTGASMNVISQTIGDNQQHVAPLNQPAGGDLGQRGYGAGNNNNSENQLLDETPFDWRAKVAYLPTLCKYFLPLLLVYFAEYFINQGLFELIYYPAITFLDHAAQYRWFQVSYQLGVMISRSSLDLLQIRNIWTMSVLQAANALLFLAHASKLIYIPSFYIVIALIVYEGLLGGFTYVNTFYRIKKECRQDRLEFAISTVTIADSLGIVMAGIAALPVHNALCKLYT